MARPNKTRCPFCGKILAINGSYPGPDPWLECVSENCELFGMEGFPWHWEAIGKRIQALNIEDAK